MLIQDNAAIDARLRRFKSSKRRGGGGGGGGGDGEDITGGAVAAAAAGHGVVCGVGGAPLGAQSMTRVTDVGVEVQWRDTQEVVKRFGRRAGTAAQPTGPGGPLDNY